MTVEQWGVRVPVRQGEETRQALIGEGALDVTLKVLRDGTALVFPVLEERGGAGRFVFEEQPGRAESPPSRTGGRDCDHAGERSKGSGADPCLPPVAPHGALPDKRGLGQVPDPHIRGACRDAIRPGQKSSSTGTGLSSILPVPISLPGSRPSGSESLRQSKEHELVLDMFAGVGPFAITLAPRCALVVAADLNPQAVLLMIENIERNRVENVLPLLADARRLERILPWKFDRIVMNLPLAGTEFLPEAFRLVRPGGTIHFYSLVSGKASTLARIRELGGASVTERVVRSYSPGQWHAVYDVVVTG